MNQDKAFDVLRDMTVGPSRYFEDFEIGEVFYIPSRTLTDALFAAFQLASGDNDPIHYDAHYCQARGYPNMLAHGMQVMIQTAAGAGTFPQQVADSLLGMVELNGKILRPVFAAQTLYPRLTVSRLKPQNTTGLLTLAAEVWKSATNHGLKGHCRGTA